MGAMLRASNNLTSQIGSDLRFGGDGDFSTIEGLASFNINRHRRFFVSRRQDARFLPLVPSGLKVFFHRHLCWFSSRGLGGFTSILRSSGLRRNILATQSTGQQAKTS